MVQGFYNSPPCYNSLQSAIYYLKGRYSFLKVYPIGKSCLDRGIFALSFGEPLGSTLYVGGVHASEWITTLLLVRFCEDLCQAMDTRGSLAGIEITRAMENHSITIIPCLNPDGVEIATMGTHTAGHFRGLVEEIWKDKRSIWQANARGVDLNHNFDAGWDEVRRLEQEAGIDKPCPSKYGGTKPFSESESLALAGFCRGYDVRQVYAFHSQGEEIYYKYGPKTPTRSKLIAQVLAGSCGYRVTSPRGTASHGGFKDWFIEKMERPGFTIEVGRGRNPLPVEDLEPIYEKILEMLVLGMML